MQGCFGTVVLKAFREQRRAAERTKMFMYIQSGVTMIDGDKIRSKPPMDMLFQNRDYNGWTNDVNRNLLLV